MDNLYFIATYLVGVVAPIPALIYLYRTKVLKSKWWVLVVLSGMGGLIIPLAAPINTYGITILGKNYRFKDIPASTLILIMCNSLAWFILCSVLGSNLFICTAVYALVLYISMVLVIQLQYDKQNLSHKELLNYYRQLTLLQNGLETLDTLPADAESRKTKLIITAKIQKDFIRNLVLTRSTIYETEAIFDKLGFQWKEDEEDN